MLQQRLALTNQIRGLLLDRGIEIAQGFYSLRTVLPRLLTDETSELTPMMRDLGRSMLAMWNHTEHAIEVLNDRIKQLANAQSRSCRRPVAHPEGSARSEGAFCFQGHTERRAHVVEYLRKVPVLLKQVIKAR